MKVKPSAQTLSVVKEVHCLPDLAQAPSHLSESKKKPSRQVADLPIESVIQVAVFLLVHFVQTFELIPYPLTHSEATVALEHTSVLSSLQALHSVPSMK